VIGRRRIRARRKTARSRTRNGFILLEVIVAITLLALIMTPLAGMVFKITQRQHRIVGGAYRNGVLMQQINLLESLPYDSLPVGTTTTTVTDKPYPYTRTVTVAQVYTKYQMGEKSVKLIITPTNPLYRPDTTTFVRTTAATFKTFISN
jgi:pilin/secretion family protein with methylation motif